MVNLLQQASICNNIKAIRQVFLVARYVPIQPNQKSPEQTSSIARTFFIILYFQLTTASHVS